MLLVRCLIAVLRSETALRVCWTQTGIIESLLDADLQCLLQET